MNRFENVLMVIDDGICVSGQGVSSLAFDIEVVNGNVRERRTNVSADSHGTVCAEIIHELCPSLRIASLKIMNGEGEKGDIQNLLAALDWCIEQEAPFLHMSLGSSTFTDFLAVQERIQQAAKKRILIVAAKSNRGCYTVPACLPEVLCVQYGHGLEPALSIDLQPEDGVDFVYSGQILRRGIAEQQCNSFAAAFIAGLIAKAGLQHFSPYEIKKRILHTKPFGLNVLERHEKDAVYFRSKKIEDIPVITIQESGKAREELASYLTGAFRNEGYFSVLLSDQKREYIAGRKYLGEDISEDVLQRCLDVYQCDLIVISALKERLKKAYEVSELVLIVQENGTDAVMWEADSEETGKPPETCPVEKSDEKEFLFKKIYAMLS